MFTMIKFCLSFCLSFLLLSVPINDKPLFFYLERWSKPVTDKIFKQSKIAFWESVEDGKKIFYNTLPTSKEDQVKVQSSSRSRAIKSRDHQAAHDNYTEEEKNMLNRILEQGQR